MYTKEEIKNKKTNNQLLAFNNIIAIVPPKTRQNRSGQLYFWIACAFKMTLKVLDNDLHVLVYSFDINAANYYTSIVVGQSIARYSSQPVMFNEFSLGPPSHHSSIFVGPFHMKAQCKTFQTYFDPSKNSLHFRGLSDLPHLSPHVIVQLFSVPSTSP